MRTSGSPARPRLSMLLAALLIAGLLAACGDEPADEEAALDEPTATTAVQEPAEDPTSTSEPAVEPTATEVPPTPTAEPTATPVPPTPTPEPTATPAPPTPTPEPTATPVPPTPTPVPPTPTPVPPPTPVSVSGAGTQLTSAVQLQAGLGIFTLNHDGGSNFIVWFYDQSTGERVDLLVNEIGPWFGSRAFEIPQTGEYLFEVNADGNWSIDILQPTPMNAEVRTKPQEYTGSGSQAIYFLNLDSGLHRVTATHNGSSNFVVWAYNSDASGRDLLVNEIGAFNGSVALQISSGGAYIVLDVQADGDWTILVE